MGVARDRAEICASARIQLVMNAFQATFVWCRSASPKPPRSASPSLVALGSRDPGFSGAGELACSRFFLFALGGLLVIWAVHGRFGVLLAAPARDSRAFM